MRKRLLTLLTLLVAIAAGAWATKTIHVFPLDQDLTGFKIAVYSWEPSIAFTDMQVDDTYSSCYKIDIEDDCNTIILCKLEAEAENDWTNVKIQTNDLNVETSAQQENDILLVITGISDGKWSVRKSTIDQLSLFKAPYYLVGSFTSWGLDSQYQLTSLGNGLYQYTGLELTTESIFKVVCSYNGSSIYDWYPNGMDNNQYVTANGTYTVNFRPNGDGTTEDGYGYIPYEGDNSGLEPHGCTRGGYMYKIVKEDCQHTPGDAVYENVVNPTCEAGGSRDVVTYCTKCQEELSRQPQNLEPLGHNWGDYETVTQPTCTASGEMKRTCIRDNSHVDTQSIPALGHDYAGVVTNPTCTEAGYTTYTCSRCHDSYTSNNTDPLGHDFSKVVDNDEGHVTMCTRCDALYMVEKTVEVCDSYQWDKDGSTYTTSQTATTVINDVTYKLYLTVNHSTSEIRNATVTIGQQYIDEKYPDGFNFTVTANTPTTQYYTTTNIEGCDHVITLNLTIQNPGISVMAANFPDPNFRDYLLNGMYYDSASGYNVRVDKNEDGYLSDEELNTPSLEFGRYYFAPNAISSVKGIELFPALKKVTCYGNNLAGAAVDEMISLLPTRSGNDGVLYFEQAGYERVNRITAQQIAAAKAKGWKVLGEFGGNWVESVGLTLPLYFEFNVGDEWDHVYLSEENIGSFKELLAAKGIAAEGSLTYDKSTHTLTIENLKVNAELHNDHQVYDRNYYEKAPMVGNLIVKGNNELKGFRTWYEQEYNIKGDGSLKITVGSVNLSTNKAIFDGPTLEVNASQYGDDQAVWVHANENVNLTIKRGTMRLTATGIPLSVGVYHGNASLTLDKRMKVTQPEGAKQFVWGEDNDYAIVFTDAQNNVLTNTTLVIETVAVPLTITVDPDIPHGAVTPNVLEADEGDIITLKCQPQTGYKLNVLTITMGDSQIAATKVGNDEPWETTTYQFTMPAGDVLLKGEYVLKDDTSGISTATVTTGDDAWYTVDGRRLEGRPTRRGVYIYKGQKVAK